jgi:predicted polyphosphate/ATP-dependent NAD kinase
MRVGVIVNPSSGRDIRRLLARASVFPTGEKINVVLRLLAALGALGIDEALVMPDAAGIAATIRREAESGARGSRRPLPAVRPLAMPVTDTVADTYRAVAMMCEVGVGAIAILGGDGTHRAAAAHCGDTPILALSTGTNNAFPELHEATSAGLALALALGHVPPEVALRRNKQLRVTFGGRRELALVDVCLERQPFLGARAIWRPDDLSRLFTTFGEPRGIGLSAITGWAMPVARDDPWGAQLVFGPGPQVMAPIAPGLVEWVGVASAERLPPHAPVTLTTGAGTISLDGERELELSSGDAVTVELELNGPLTIDIEATLAYAARHALLTRSALGQPAPRSGAAVS